MARARLVCVSFVLLGGLLPCSGAAGLTARGLTPGTLGAQVPLIGAGYTHFVNPDCSLAGTGIVADGEAAPRRIERQLAAMRAAGIESVRLIMWNTHDATGQDWGVVSSRTGRLTQPYRANFIRYLKNVRRDGFKRLTIAFGQYGPNEPIYYGPSGIASGYDPALFSENWAFIRDVRSLVERYGPPSKHFDIDSEGVPGPSDDPALAKIADDYITRLYRDYVQAFGNQDVTIAFVGVLGPADAAGRAKKLVADLRASGEPLPTWFDVHPSYSPQVLPELQAIDTALSAEGLSQPLVIGEEAYNDPAVAQAIAKYEATSARPVTEVLEWPLTADRPCKDISVSAPYRADAYLTALTGQPPSTALKAQVTSPRHIALKTPYGNPVTALEAGHYTVTVRDRSPRASFHLLGPGLNLHTTRHFTGTKTWAVDLQHGSYRYGPGPGHASLTHRFTVLAAQAPENDLALGRPATASRSDPGSPPSDAVDGLYDTSWNAGDFAPQWIQIDLGTAQTVGRIRLIVAQNPPGYTDHRIWVRGPNTGDPERLACELTGNTGDPQSLICQPPNPITDVRYVRVETLTSPSWIAWREIEIYAH